MATAKSTSIVLLDEKSPEKAMVRMQDGDNFLVAVTDAARACHAFDKAKQFGVQFGELLRTLSDWVESKRDKIKRAHLTVRESDILFLVVLKAAAFDSELSDQLTDLDIQIANSSDLDLVDLEVLAIPSVSEESCEAFIASGQTYTYAKP